MYVLVTLKVHGILQFNQGTQSRCYIVYVLVSLEVHGILQFNQGTRSKLVYVLVPQLVHGIVQFTIKAEVRVTREALVVSDCLCQDGAQITKRQEGALHAMAMAAF